MNPPPAAGLAEPAAPTECQPAPPVPPRTALRSVLYALLAAAAAGPLFFRQINSAPLAFDEARYANCVQVIRDTGQWVSITDVPGRTYFQKPPLYMWLTALTYDHLGEGEVRYRFWSGAFGVAAVALTCLLGGWLLSPETGLLAAAVLMLDEQFLFTHGARTGTMDTALTFLLLACAAAYWAAWHAGRRRVWAGGWLTIGLLAAAASLFKPLMGLLFIGLLAAHALALGRPAPWWRRAAGPLIALAACAAVAGPWYVVQYQRFGQPFADQMLLWNLWGRVTRGRDPGTIRPWYYYFGTVARSFGGPVLGAVLLPAALGLSVAVAAGFVNAVGPVPRLRRAHGLIAFLTLGWLVVVSLSRTKFSHYPYPVYPLIALSVASLLLAAAAALLRRVRDDATRRRLAVGAAAAALGWFAFRHAWVLYDQIPRRAQRYAPWEVYQALRGPIDQGRVRLVLCGFGPTPLDWDRNVPRLDSMDHYYLRRMRRLSRVEEAAPEQIPELLAQRRPTVLVVPRHLEHLVADVDGRLAGRRDERFSYEQDAFLMMTVDLGELTDARWTPAAPGAGDGLVGLGRDGGPLPEGPAELGGGFRLRLARPWREDAWLSIRVEADGPPPSGRWAVRLGGRKVAEARVYPAPGGYRVAGPIAAGQWRKAEPAAGTPGSAVELVIEPETPDGRSGSPGRVVEARLTFYPRPLTED